MDKDKEEKQAYLETYVLDAGYDPEHFATYMNKKKCKPSNGRERNRYRPVEDAGAERCRRRVHLRGHKLWLSVGAR